MQRSPLLAAGALNGAIAVAAGAFGAHGLKDRLEPKALKIFETAARYHMYHALAMVLCALLLARATGWIFQLGIVLFSGSLYALAVTDAHFLVFLTPLGGLALLVAWSHLAWSAWKG